MRNSAAPTISEGSPARCKGWRSKGLLAPQSEAPRSEAPKPQALLMSVRKGPGMSVLTRTVGP